MTWKLSGPSTIITGDERLSVFREGTDVPRNVVYVDGKPIKRYSTTFQVTCAVMPIQGRDLLLVPEGDRERENYWCFTNNQDVTLRLNDFVIREDLQTSKATLYFQVQSVENWGSFQRVRLMRIDVGPLSTVQEN